MATLALANLPINIVLCLVYSNSAVQEVILLYTILNRTEKQAL